MENFDLSLLDRSPFPVRAPIVTVDDTLTLEDAPGLDDSPSLHKRPASLCPDNTIFDQLVSHL
jgi:hypothetical protein